MGRTDGYAMRRDVGVELVQPEAHAHGAVHGASVDQRAIPGHPPARTQQERAKAGVAAGHQRLHPQFRAQGECIVVVLLRRLRARGPIQRMDFGEQMPCVDHIAAFVLVDRQTQCSFGQARGGGHLAGEQVDFTALDLDQRQAA